MKPKYTYSITDLDILRNLAINYAHNLRRATANPKDRAAAEAKLIGICTAIEVLTVNGNYYAEMAEAIKQAEKP